MAGAKSANWSKFGFTTGMAAAAAAATAAEFLRDGVVLKQILLETPAADRQLMIDVESVRATRSGAVARVIKNAGPDRDITDGMMIESSVEPTTTGYVGVVGGPGIGLVTLPGLAVPMGQAAINPVPSEHIRKLVRMRCPEGARVTISAAGGEAVAKKTFNPRLGIKGGISILGTSGLVRPMSADAWQAALLSQLDQAVALGHNKIALTPGNLGARAAQSMGVPKTAVAQMSNFVGYMLREADKRGLNIILIGHLGKMVKVAAGYENTHHKRTRDRMNLLSEIVGETNPGLAARLAGLASAEAAIALLSERGPQLIDNIARRAAEQAGRIINNHSVGVVITNLSGHAVGIEPTAAGMLGQRW